MSNKNSYSLVEISKLQKNFKMSKKQLNTSIFTICKDYQFNAVLMHHQYGLNAYTYAYAETIKILFDKVLYEDPGLIDFVVYPLLFICRHYFEVQCKLIIYLDKGKHDKHHNLKKLWSLAKVSIKNRWPNANEPKEFYKIEQIINEFNDVDFNSMTFRYAHDKSEKIHLVEQTHINLRAFYEDLHPLIDFLECISDGWKE